MKEVEVMVLNKYRKFTYEEFVNLADFKKKGKNVIAKKELLVTTKRGFQFYVGSSYEKTIFNRYNKDPHVIDIRGQDYAIPYYDGKHNYYPDLLIYFKNRTVLIYEVKPVIQMVNYENLRKFQLLKQYADTNGFRYAYGSASSATAQIKTIDDIKRRKVNKSFRQYFKLIMKTNNVFTSKDLDNYKKEHHLVGVSKRNQLEYDVACLVLNHLNKYRLYHRPKEHNYSWIIRKGDFINIVKI